MKITFFSCKEYEQPRLEKYLSPQFEASFQLIPLRLESCEKAEGSKVVSVFSRDDASAPVLTQLANLGVEFIATRSTGFNHIDLEAARQKGIGVAHVPAYSPHAIAEHTILLMLALSRKLIQANERIRVNNFSLKGLMGFNLGAKRIGVIGTGKIGKAIIEMLKGFGSEVIAYDIKPDHGFSKSLGFDYIDMGMLLRSADIVTLHVPLNDQTHYLIDNAELTQMKEGALLINTSRGKLINTSEVLRALQSGHLSALGIDVYENEHDLFFEDHSTKKSSDPLFDQLNKMENVLITGHQAFLTETALDNIAKSTIENIQNFSSGTKSDNFLI